MPESDPLRRRSDRPLGVKICGLTSVAEAVACAEAGAGWIGLNFHPGSPRRVDLDTAAAIVKALPDHVAAVGLFVDRPPLEIVETCARVGLSVVQLHGSEPIEDLITLEKLFLARRLERLFLIRAFRLRDDDSVSAARTYLRDANSQRAQIDAILIDGYAPGLAGGTGQAIVDDLLDPFLAFPIGSLYTLFLAGGLTPENVADRVKRAQPSVVDVASGVESSPGRKDLARVEAFVKAVRSEPATGVHSS